MATRRLKRPRDPIQLGKLIVDIATGQVADRVEDDRELQAVERGRKGGIKGGPARAEQLDPQRRREIAQKAADARWAKKRSPE
jgi:hypothetical protein